MKKSKLLAAVMASIALTGGISGCGFDPFYNDEPDVYGPPMPYEEPDEEEPEVTEDVEKPQSVEQGKSEASDAHKAE